jgi:mRNA-degrading endonuclease toxin of MazEF toxin-antitoxin module
MNNSRWDIVFLRVDENDPVGHPAVVLSSDDIMGNPRHLRFNAVAGTKRPPARTLAPSEVILNGSDGLGFQTVVECGIVIVARKQSVLRLGGRVCHERRREIARKVRAYLGLG